MSLIAAIFACWFFGSFGFVAGAWWAGRRRDDEYEEFEVQQPATGGASAGERQ